MDRDNERFSKTVRENTSEGKTWGGMGSALESHDRLMTSQRTLREGSFAQAEYLRGKLLQQEARLAKLL